MWILFVDEEDGLVARVSRPRERLRAWLRAERLDRELARGVPPEANVLLAIRAQVLVRPSTRRILARSLQRVVIEASRPGPYRSVGKVLPRRDEVERARPTISALIDHLLSPRPLPARGIAQVKDLLTNGYGPLYSAKSPDSLGRLAAQAIDAFAGSRV